MNEQQKYFIIEEAYIPSSKPEIIDEKIVNSKYKIIFRTILQEADVKNNNKRIYPKEVLQKVVEELQPKAKNRELLGELDHPWIDSNDPTMLKKRASQIRLSEVCVLIRDIQFDGKYVIAECETLTTKKGLDLYALIKDGVNFGFSLRALGSVKPIGNGTVVVQPDIKPITYDVVSNPSHKTARILEFLSEDINLFISSVDTNNILVENSDNVSSQTKKIIVPIGAIINDLNSDDELQKLINNDNVNVQSISIYIDTDNNVFRVCNNNICIERNLDDILPILFGRKRFSRLFGIDTVNNDLTNDSNNSNCEFYPLIGTGRIIKTLTFSNYKPFLSPDIQSSIEKSSLSTFNIPDIDIDDDIDDIDNTCGDIDTTKPPTLEPTIQKILFNSLSENEILSLLSDTKYEHAINELFESIYRNDYDSLDFEYNELSPETIITIPSISTIAESTSDDIDYQDYDDYVYKFASLSESLDSILSVYYNNNNNNNPNEVLSIFNESFNNILSELNNIPDHLFDLILEDESYDPSSSINNLVSLIESSPEYQSKFNYIFKSLLKEDINSAVSNLPTTNSIKEILIIDDIINSDI